MGLINVPDKLCELPFCNLGLRSFFFFESSFGGGGNGTGALICLARAGRPSVDEPAEYISYGLSKPIASKRSCDPDHTL